MEPWPIKKLLDWSADYFKQKGLDSPRLDAEILLAHVLNVRRIDLYLQFDRPLAQTELAAFKALVKRRAQHEPVAYITGKKEFCSREFFVSRDVLVPRPETELLVECVVGRWSLVVGKDLRGFELGLGSGNIAVTLLAQIPTLKMTAVENSQQAIEIAKKNAIFHGVSDRLEIIEMDFFSTNDQRPTTNDQFDFILSNPPYIRSDEIASLPPDVKNFEPHQALDGGPDGLKYYREFATFAKAHLSRDGFYAVEVGEDQAEAVCGIFKDAGLVQTEVIKDYAGHDRVVVGRF